MQPLDETLVAFHPPQREMTRVHRISEHDTGVSCSAPSVAVMTVSEFFADYAEALLARDAAAIARMYAVPALIVFPGRSIPVTDEAETEAFFASNWDQYEGVDEASPQVDVLAESAASVWADVTWSYGGSPRERFCYQLVPAADGYRIAVLTPL
ncbi:hypothetical protein GCM10023175_19250 [Pseudonocardia xishanensis]|uniref:SnoaL-like protein n=2 Tax=Pseudonocardia xishanensis TaxID=630995 RepID=A0ABP8RNA9_9PSEU